MNIESARIYQRQPNAAQAGGHCAGVLAQSPTAGFAR